MVPTWKVVDLLMRLHAGKEFRLDVIVSPAEIEVEVHYGVCLHVPPVLLGDVLDHGVLGFCVSWRVPATLMTILCFFVENWFL